MHQAIIIGFTLTFYGSKLVIIPFGLISSNKNRFPLSLIQQPWKYVLTQPMYMVVDCDNFSLM